MNTTLSRALVLVSLLLILQVGPSCGNGDDGSGTGSEAVITEETVITEEGDTGGDDSGETDEEARVEKVLADAEALEPLLNSFWADELQRVYGLEFDPPDRFEYYQGEQNSSCGLDAASLPRNAYYCLVDSDEYVAFDLDWFQGYLVDFPEGATTFLILAHEWGHAVQDTWVETGGTDVWDPPYRKELNADCLAGVFLSDAIAAGDIIEEPGDADAIFSWLYTAGGPWLDPGTHGTKEQRIAAFSEGYTNSTEYCRTEY